MSLLANRSSAMDFQYLQRAKVYRLNDEGKWDDKGTGHVSVEYLERSEAVGLVVLDEEDNATLLVHRISADDIYRRQEDTIISWTDPEDTTDLALSFQEAMGCSYIWDQICNVQRNIHFPSVSALDVGPRSANEELEHSGTSQDGVNTDILELPVVELSSLPQIVKILGEVPSSFLDRDRITLLIVRDPIFLRKLMELFRVCEDLENMDGLHMLYKIVKGIISLNDGRIFDIIFNDDYIMDIVGTLEYDPEIPTRQDHRTFLREQVIFKEAVPIREPAILSKIHQTYRIGYIKDVILPRVLDDQTFTTINTMILANNVAVVSALQDDSTFIKDLFARLRTPMLPEKTRKDLVHFLQEFCSLSKSLQLVHRVQLVSTLVREGLFDIITDALQSSDESLRLSGTDILIVVLNYDPGILRKFLVQQKDHTLFSLLVTGMLTPGQGGLQAQLLEVMRMLLDCDTLDRQPPDKNPFLEVFYAEYMDQMMERLTTACPGKGSFGKVSSSDGLMLKTGSGSVTAEILGNICELMCFCVHHHSYRIKYYVMRNNVMEKVLRLTQRKEKYLVVTAVRFLRTCVGKKDEFYNRYIVKNDLFGPVIQAFLANGSRYNLLNSAVLELMDFIGRENVKNLVAYIIEKYSEKMEKIDYVDTFQQLKLKYEQSLEGATGNARESGVVTSGGKDCGPVSASNRLNESTAPGDPRKRQDERAPDKEEEDYFNDSDDEEDTASARTTMATGQQAQAVIVNGSALGYENLRGPFGLVDYEDEDEDSSVLPGSNGNEVLADRNPDSMVSSVGTVDLSPPFAMQGDAQTVKRKTNLPGGKDDELEIMKRRKTFGGATGQAERDPARNSMERPVNRDEAGSSDSLDYDNDSDSLTHTTFTGSIVHTNERMAEHLAKNAPNASSFEQRSTDSGNGPDASTESGVVTNGNSVHSSSGTELKTNNPHELTRGDPSSPGTYSFR